jgi:heat shock protein HtpX
MALASVGLSSQIRNNHLKSALLLMGFPILLLLIMGSFLLVMDALMQKSVPGNPTVDWGRSFSAAESGMLRYGHLAMIAAGLWFIIAYLFHGRMMRAATGAQPVTRQQYPKIYNMLENLCISRGLPMPRFEIIDSPALNAFATGIDRKSYRIVLTRGLVEHLQDDELEAVIAHELTHIINRDVQLLIISVIFVGIISFLAEMAFRMLVHGRRPNYYARHDNRGSGALVLLVALAVLAVGYLFAIVIRFALSRRREYLADAGSIELTKNPEAMMRALMRISGREAVPGMPDEVQQMCIHNSHAFLGLFSTHPSVDDRIKTISAMTQTPVPALPVSLRRIPRGPWEKDVSF